MPRTGTVGKRGKSSCWFHTGSPAKGNQQSGLAGIGNDIEKKVISNIRAE
jgi:hypothetical protein